MNVLNHPLVAEERLRSQEDAPRPAIGSAQPGPQLSPDAPEPRAPRRKPWLALAIAAVVAGGGAYWYANRETPAPSGIAAAQASTLPPGEFRLNDNEIRSLRIEPVLLRDFRAERLAEGRIGYNEDRSTPVFSPYTGRVIRAVARLGEQVQAGETLFEVETTDLVQAANDLLAAVDNLAKARTTLELSRRNEARQRELFNARAASRRDMEQAEADAANAAADQRVAETALSAARDRMRVLGRTPEQIERIETTRRVEGIVAVTAPIAGTVVQRRVGSGQWLTSGQGDPVFTISDLSSMWLVAAVRELDAPLMRVGQDVTVSVNALPDRTFRARITNVGSALDATTRRLPVRAEVDDPERLLRPEMFATFRIAVGGETRQVGVPVGAVIYRGPEAGVWVALPDNRFALRPIRVGIRAGDVVEVTGGLAAGERVVTGGALFVDRAARID